MSVRISGIVVGITVACGAIALAPVAHSAPSVSAARPHAIAGTHCQIFPSDNVWRANISALPVNSRSAQWVAAIGRSDDLHPDFGSAGPHAAPYGIPITVVSGSHRVVHVSFQYSSESDHSRYPLGADTKIEGGSNSTGDRHAIVVNKATCTDYETYATRHTSSGWKAGSGAIWSLGSDKLRYKPALGDLAPYGLTSADAAGLPILAGLLRVNEVKAGYVDHAIRFTAPVTSEHFIWPAEHEAGSKKSLSYPPMGARFRLKASFHLAGASRDTRVVLAAMKTFGLILADNGSSWYFQGEASRHWSNTMIEQLKEIPASAFQAVDESGLRVSAHSGRAVARG
jgi:hypothetical protein